MTTTLLTRILSALVGVGIIAFAAWLLKSIGLIVLCLAVNVGVIYEFASILRSHNRIPLHLCWLFAALCFHVVVLGVFRPQWALGFTTVVFSTLIATALVMMKDSDDLQALLHQITMLLLGVVYCGLFPTAVISLLVLEQGQVWFLTYLAVVFAGDTSAYFAGKLFGQRKMLPTISPKKTWAGSVGGLLGSVIALSVIRGFFLTEVPFYWLLPLTVLTAGLAQAGDFFESLIKRVASVKDSGRLMPGHGGLMDRVDGVYFAAPLFYLAAFYLEMLSKRV